MEKELINKIDTRTKPIGSLGKLEKIAYQIGMIQKSLTPQLNNPTILVFAADHGIAEEGVSPFPKDITFQMVMNFTRGGAGINVFTKQNGIKLKVIDCGVDYDFPEGADIVNAKLARGTTNMIKEPAMSIDMCREAIEKGREFTRCEFESGCNTIGFGEMGIGNTSAASLLLHKYGKFPLEECVGRGAGHNDDGLNHKLEILKKVAKKYNPKDPLEILATFGGLEIAMMCGAILEARRLNMVILADGFIATSAFMAAHQVDPKIQENTIFCHTSGEKGHALMLKYFKADPLLNMDLRLGEGTGAAIAYPIIKSALLFLNEMAGFDEL
jgi:nicotinate-nucleotide--dimethylbenzimidazole phosphoribosyltransferase